jgi:hypothetical protein
VQQTFLTRFLTIALEFRQHALASAESEMYLHHCGFQVSSAEQNNETTKEQKDTEDRMNASVITEQHLAEMVPPVIEGLRDAGYFIDDIKIGNIPRPFIITTKSRIAF